MSQKATDYLNISRAESLKNPKERFLYRLLEILPGFLSWSVLIGAFLFSWLVPAIVAIFIILFDLYWLLKTAYLSFHQVSSFRQMKKNIKTDWIEKLEHLEGWKRIYHIVILPMYKEGKGIIRSSCQSLVASKYPKERMIIVLSAEERAGKEAT